MADRAKLKSVIAYLAGKTTLGKVKLFKLMYLADFTARARLGRSITDEVYENFEMGPVPRTLWRDFDRIASECVSITPIETQPSLLPEQRMTPLPNVVLSLTVEDQGVLDDILRRFGNMSGNQLREITHHTIPYRATPRGEAIPYGLAGYMEYVETTQADVDIVLSDRILVQKLQDRLQRLSVPQ